MKPTEADRTIRAIVVDDEPLARDAVRLAVERVGGATVVAECGDGETAVRVITTVDADLVFLDVQMPGCNGFDVIERVGPDRMPPVVFVTAYDAHLLRAFEIHALDYVLKPFDDLRFAEVLAHARERLARERGADTAQALLAMLQGRTAAGAGSYAERIMVAQDDRIRFVPVNAIAYLQSDGNYVRVHTADTAHRVRATLTELIGQLDPRRFIRIHRSMVINVNHLREVQPWFGGDYVAILRDGRQVRVSRRYRDRLLRTTL